MCQSKAQGGRRCPSSSAAAQRTRRAINRSFLSPSQARTTAEDLRELLSHHVSLSKSQLAHLSEKQLDSLKAYTNQDYENINRLLYDGEAVRAEHEQMGEEDKLQQYEEHIEILDSVFDSVPERSEPVTLYRSFRPPVEPSQAGQWVQENFKEGEVVQLPTYLSTSRVPDAMLPMLSAPSYSSWGLEPGQDPVLVDDDSPKNTVFEIRTKKGVAVSSAGHMPQEQEELLPRGMKFRVVGIKEGVTYRSDQSLLFGRTGYEQEQEKKTRVVFLEEVEEEHS